MRLVLVLCLLSSGLLGHFRKRYRHSISIKGLYQHGAALLLLFTRVNLVVKTFLSIYHDINT